jgi:DNA/RNA non-specific endonuclease
VKKADDVYIASGPVFAPSMMPDGSLASAHRFIGALLQRGTLLPYSRMLPRGQVARLAALNAAAQASLMPSLQSRPAPSHVAAAKLHAAIVRAGQAPQAVGVPTHFYKVVLSERTDVKSGARQSALAAFAMPNRPIDPATPLTSFVVPLEFLESVTGIEFFARVVTDAQRSAVDAAAAGALTSSLCGTAVSQSRRESMGVCVPICYCVG